MNGQRHFEAGERIGRYRIVKTIGSGSSGTVYEAFDERLDRPVALKIAAVSQPLADDDELTARFTREARFAASLSHPNLCPVYDFGRHEGWPYLVMALLPGATLADLIARHAPLPADRILVLVRPIAEALAEMHRVGLVHGDLKPRSILLDARLEPMLTDYGLARPELFVRRGGSSAKAKQASASEPALRQTPAFQAPEQIEASTASGAPFAAGPRLGPAVDMHALGVILYLLLAGRLPYAGDAEETAGKILETEPEPPSRIATGVSRDLEQICLQLLRKDPAERPSAAEVARRLRLLAGRAGAASGRWNDSLTRSAEPEGDSGNEAATERRGEPAAGGGKQARRAAPGWLLAMLLGLLALGAVGYALYAYVPWQRIAGELPEGFAPAPQADAEPAGASRPGGVAGSAGEGHEDAAGGVGGGGQTPDPGTESAGRSGSRVGDPLSQTPSPISLEEIDPQLASPPARLFIAEDRIVVAAATVPAAAEGNVAAWWAAGEAADEAADDAAADAADDAADEVDGGAFEAAGVLAESLVPLRDGGSIAGVVTSRSGQTVGILGESWYGRIRTDDGSLATNPVRGWVTVEQAATSPSGRFALLQKTGLQDRKRISVWEVVDGANPSELMAHYAEPSTTAVALSPSGRGLAVGDAEGRVTVRPVGDEAQVLAELSVAEPVTAVAFSGDNRKLAVAHRAAGIAIFEYRQGQWQEAQPIRLGGATARHLGWSADGAWLAGVLDPSDSEGEEPAASEPAASEPAASGPRANAPKPPLPFARLWPVQRPAAAVRIPDVAGTAIGFLESGEVLVGHGDGLVRRWRIR